MPNYGTRVKQSKKRKVNFILHAQAMQMEEDIMQEEEALSHCGESQGEDRNPPSAVDDDLAFTSSFGDDEDRITNVPTPTFSDDSSSEATYSPDDDDAERDDEFIDLLLNMEETARSEEVSPDVVTQAERTACQQPLTILTQYEDSDLSPPDQDAKVEWSPLEVASLELISLCDDSGARRGFYDQLLALLRTFQKQNIDVSKAKNRDTLLARLGKKVSTPKAKVSMVDGRPVVYFPFLDSLRDLLSSTTFNNVDNLCVNREEENRFKPFQPVAREDYGEVMANDWARDSLDQIDDFDSESDLFVPLMIYGDKTGTDVNQRYPLEPWMFTVCLLRRFAREKSDSWRHLGFQPSMDFLDTLSAHKKLQRYHDFMSVLIRELKEACSQPPVMWVNLGGVWQKRRLLLRLGVLSGDQLSQDTICGRMPINAGSAGRIHRGCGSSAIHLGCALDDNGILSGKCRPPPTLILKRLNRLALLDIASLVNGPLKELVPPASGKETKRQNKLMVEYLQRVQKLAKAILNKVFSTYEHNSAFDGVDFGSNVHGPLVAATDDHLHSFEAGILYEFDMVAYHGLTPSELTEFEGIIRKMVIHCRSSALNELPRGTVKKDFGRLTLQSHTEKVGSAFYLLLALHTKRGRELFQKAHSRQAKKYLSFTLDVTPKGDEQTSTSRTADAGEESNAQEHEECRNPAEKPSSNGKVLPPSAFPFRSDLLFGSDHKDKNCFDRTDESISFVCKHLRLHGFGFILEHDALDVYQLDLLMVSTWAILRLMEDKKEYPSESTLEDLLLQPEFKDIIPSDLLDDDETNEDTSSPVESSCLSNLPREIPDKVVDPNGSHDTTLTAETNHPSLPIHGTVEKHRRKKPKVKGSGYTGAVLSDTDTFVAFLELMLTYHAWCHFSGTLSREEQEDYELINFGRRTLVQTFDAVIYRGDNSVDSALGKLHTQLHDSTKLFGDQMGHNAGTGERGLKVWAKGASHTALKHGRDVFTESTSGRIEEGLLINRGLEKGLKWKAEHMTFSTRLPPPASFRRKVAHFRFERNQSNSSETRLLALDRYGKAQSPNQYTGRIQKGILDAIHQIESAQGNDQDFFEIWCEAKLPNKQYVRCWPQYRSGQGTRFDWVVVKFQTDTGVMEYPAKVLALYEDCTNGTFNALVHSVEYKLRNAKEGPYGDSRLMTHYRLQFDNRGYPQLTTVPFQSIVRCVVGYENRIYGDPLVPRTRSGEMQKRHTVMIVRPRDQWAKLYLVWMREHRARQGMVNGRNRNRLDFPLDLSNLPEDS